MNEMEKRVQMNMNTTREMDSVTTPKNSKREMVSAKPREMEVELIEKEEEEKTEKE